MVDEDTEALERHNRVCAFAEAGLPAIYSGWAKKKAVEPFVVTWPSTPVTSLEGKTISGPCLLHLTGIDPVQWSERIAQAVSLTGAYAVLLTEQKSDAVVLILESRSGSRCWRLPIVRSGDVDRLGRPKITNNLEHLGVLWSSRKNQA